MSRQEGEGASAGDCVVSHAHVGDEADFTPWEAKVEGVDLSSSKVMAEDGLPTEEAGAPHSDIPALSPDTLMCLGVFDEFVIRNVWGDVLATFKPEEVERAHGGRWRVKWGLATSRLLVPGCEDVDTWVKRHCRLCIADFDNEWFAVEPIRPPCAHYAVQLGQADYNPEIKSYYRLCSARRTTEGAMMAVDDTGMWACTMREPPCIDTEKRIAKFDAEKEEAGRNRIYLPIVGTKSERIDPDLQKVAEQSGLGSLGGAGK